MVKWRVHIPGAIGLPWQLVVLVALVFSWGGAELGFPCFCCPSVLFLGCKCAPSLRFGKPRLPYNAQKGSCVLQSRLKIGSAVREGHRGTCKHWQQKGVLKAELLNALGNGILKDARNQTSWASLTAWPILLLCVIQPPLNIIYDLFLRWCMKVVHVCKTHFCFTEMAFQWQL